MNEQTLEEQLEEELKDQLTDISMLAVPEVCFQHISGRQRASYKSYEEFPPFF